MWFLVSKETAAMLSTSSPTMNCRRVWGFFFPCPRRIFLKTSIWNNLLHLIGTDFYLQICNSYHEWRRLYKSTLKWATANTWHRQMNLIIFGMGLPQFTREWRCYTIAVPRWGFDFDSLEASFAFWLICHFKKESESDRAAASSDHVWSTWKTLRKTRGKCGKNGNNPESVAHLREMVLLPVSVGG